MDRLVYVVGSEQEYHFAVLFEIFKLLGYSFAQDCFHMSYGMISLPDGKMKSREGNVVDADRLFADMTEKVLVQMQGREGGEGGADIDISKVAPKIAMGAIKFFILKFDSKKAFVFDRESSLSFSGESGVYIHYTFARCSSIIDRGLDMLKRRDESLSMIGCAYTLLKEPEEHQLLLMLSEFGSAIESAGEKYQPYLVARYLLDLCQLFNSFYQKHKVVADDLDISKAKERYALVKGVEQVLKNGLGLLGMETIDRM